MIKKRSVETNSTNSNLISDSPDLSVIKTDIFFFIMDELLDHITIFLCHGCQLCGMICREMSCWDINTKYQSLTVSIQKYLNHTDTQNSQILLTRFTRPYWLLDLLQRQWRKVASRCRRYWRFNSKAFALFTCGSGNLLILIKDKDKADFVTQLQRLVIDWQGLSSPSPCGTPGSERVSEGHVVWCHHLSAIMA